ncbi:hypothetical protein [Dysgonomonas mossii]|uniref:hypothetical protein n=1 Tax=Dysgonomonas mossii TaxID=163665 RepID=UPI0039969C5B
METMTYERLTEIVEEANNRIDGCVERVYKKHGIPLDLVSAGGMIPIFITDTSLENNIKNILAIFTTNFGEGTFFQAMADKYETAFNKAEIFINSRGLDDEFNEYIKTAQYKKNQAKYETAMSFPEN